jgi:hypothetical protein
VTADWLSVSEPEPEETLLPATVKTIGTVSALLPPLI